MATIVIGLIMMGFLLFRGKLADDGFAVIGDTAAVFFSLFGLDGAGGVLPGVVWHYLIGLAFGVIFGAADKLSRGFTKEFGSTQCQAITQCDFSDTTGVSNYMRVN